MFDLKCQEETSHSWDDTMRQEARIEALTDSFSMQLKVFMLDWILFDFQKYDMRPLNSSLSG